MAHRLDVVAIGIEHEGAVVVRMILWTQTRRAIVAGAGGECRAIKGVDGTAVIGGDRNVQRRLEPAFAADPEIGLALLAESGSGASAVSMVRPYLHDQRVAERRQRLFVERLGTRVVGNGKADMIDHGNLPADAVATCAALADGPRGTS